MDVMFFIWRRFTVEALHINLYGSTERRKEAMNTKMIHCRRHIDVSPGFIQSLYIHEVRTAESNTIGNARERGTIHLQFMSKHAVRPR
jgi:hypothetical protein